MSIDNQSKITNKSNSQNSSNSVITKEFELIKEYLNHQPEQINKLNNISNILSNIINNFIEITKNYSSQIEFLAMKIIPNYSVEGQLMQSIQGILLFYSEGLNNLVNELKDNMIVKQQENISEIIEQFKVQKKLYWKKITNINSSYKAFKKEINLYQEYLVNKEYEEHKKKGNLRNNCDDSIIIEENKIKEEIENNKDNIEFIEENKNEYPLNEKDNKTELIKSNKEYIKYINESNDILNKIRQFLSIEKTNILKSIFNLCHYFVDGLFTFAKNNVNNFETQKQVLNNLQDKLFLGEKSAVVLDDFSIKLKYLEIYFSHILEKKNLQINISNDIPKIDYSQKNKKNDINNNKKSDIKTKTFNIKKKNISLIMENNKHKNDIHDKKSLILSDKKLNYNYMGKKIINQNQLNDFLEKEKEKIFKSMVIELNRDEIINIFEKIKETNITLNESDLKLIENEKNYKKIKEILTTLFIHPEKYKEENKNDLINIFEKDKKYIFYFIKVLNDNRTKGNFLIQELTLKNFGELLKYLNNFILSKNDMEIFKYIVILSQTYYYNSEEDKKKVYLFSYIKDYPGYLNPKLWDDYLKELIKHELKNLPEINTDINNINLDKTTKVEKEKLMNCFFSNLLTTSKTMADFNIDKKFVIEFIEKNKTKYYLSQEQIDNICLLYEMSLQEEEANNKQEQMKNEKKIIDEENITKENNKDKNNNEQNEIKNLIENKIIGKNEIIIENNLKDKDEIKNKNNNIENNNENNIINDKTKDKVKDEVKEENSFFEKENNIKDINAENDKIGEDNKLNIEEKFNNTDKKLDKELKIEIVENNIDKEKQEKIIKEKNENDEKNIEKVN